MRRPLLLFLLAALLPEASSAASFVPLGFLPGGSYSFVWDVSDDGSTVVGNAGSTATPSEAFVWTAGGGMRGLGTGSATRSIARGASGDGSVVVGRLIDERSNSYAFRWTAAGGMDLFLGSGPSGQAMGVSADGGTIVLEDGSLWTEAGGRVHLPSASSALAISADGSVVVGTVGLRFANSEAAYWVGTDAPVTIMGQLSEAIDVSADGSVVLGQSGIRPFRWTADSGSVPLCCLELSWIADAYGISGDGTSIVGSMESGTNSSIAHAWIWDPVEGFRLVQDLLADDYGLDLAGWTLEGASGISADGRTLAGWGTNPDGQTEAWLAVLPEPTLSALAVAALCVLAVRRRLGSGTPRC